MLRLLLISIIVFFGAFNARSQGCVAIRSSGMTCMAHSSNQPGNKKWTLSSNLRYFNSFRHFVGTDEQKQRVQQGSQVINRVYSMDLTISRDINSSWSVAVNVPVISNTRSSLYEHDKKKRYSTNSFGLGDMRFTVYKWLLNPDKGINFKRNIQVGIGIKLPTGDYKYQDHFHITDSTQILGPVDQSIQLGDGGTGFTLELNGFSAIYKNLSAYGNVYYLVNPREQNGVSTSRGGTTSASSIANGSDVMSVPDQFMWRAGVNYMVKRFSFAAGLRNEGIPVYDLVGGSNGFRRPGYVLSVEPSVSYKYKNFTAYVTVPFAVKRSRTQSVPDKIKTNLTRVYTRGDAAFSDYTINIGFAIKF